MNAILLHIGRGAPGLFDMIFASFIVGFSFCQEFYLRRLDDCAKHVIGLNDSSRR